ncbi:MAG: 4-oxalocrotonate tautomerase family protein [Planctomycetota bacterium]
MPLIHVAWFPRPEEKKTEFARAITRVCEELLGARPEDVEILFEAIEPANWFVAGQSYASPSDG